MQFFIGLGNPGPKYSETRHNLGAMTLQWLFPSLIFKIEKKFESIIAIDKSNDRILLLPQTYMNLSGQAVSKVLHYYKGKIEDCIVFHDELELPAGEVKYKIGGGHRGHNGLRDIIAKMGSPDFHRIRLGIGRPPAEHVNHSVADYVLSNLDKSILNNHDELIKKVVDLIVKEIKIEL